MVLDEGQVLDGKYVILRLLAMGSMGEVYLGRNERIGKEVAVKVLRRDFADDRAIVNRFEQEARIATTVRSSHVADVYDLGELPSGERFIVMEYVEGESLGMRMAREGKLSSRALGAIALQILDGLAAAHAVGVVHRDLKPDNVILTNRDGQEIVKLVDFGVAKRSVLSSAEAGVDLKRATLDGMLVGTPMFMSPEQARGEPGTVDHRTDIFSLGVSMYEALAGEVPFNADNVVQLLSKIMTDEEIPLEKRVPHVDPGLARIVKKAMAKDADDRYQTALEMRQALAAWYAVYGSTSATRSSLEGVVRSFSLMPSLMPFNGPIRILGVPIDRKRAQVAVAAAAVAAAITLSLTRGPAPSASATAATQLEPPSQAIVVPTIPATSMAPPGLVVAPTAAPATEAPVETTSASIGAAQLPPAPAVIAPISAPLAAPLAVATSTSMSMSKKAPVAVREPTPARSARAAQERPAPRTNGDAGLLATRDGGAPASARDAGAVMAKADEIPAPPTPVDTPLPDPPAIP
jgi:eukaryotic-like serine/threonine-protein kinase